MNDKINDVVSSLAVALPELIAVQVDPVLSASKLQSREYESPQVGLPHSAFRETEDERKNRLSAQCKERANLLGIDM